MNLDNVELTPYQIPAVKKGVQLGRTLVKAPMGSGKTLMCLKILHELGIIEDEVPVIIVGRINAQTTWLKEIAKWVGTSARCVIQDGTPKQRKIVWQNIRDYHFVLLTPMMYLQDYKKGLIPHDQVTICDEPHRYMRKSQNAMYEAIRSRTLHSPVVLLPTGTPMRTGPRDMWPMLHLCNRQAFPSFWRYANTWHVVFDNGFAQELGPPKNIANFKQEVCGQHTVWVPDEEVKKYLPERQRVPIHLVPSDEQIELIRQVFEDMRVEGGDRLILTPSVMTQIMRMRQILVTPKLINPAYGYGAAIEEVVDRLEELSVPRPVVFTPFAEACPFIAEAIRGADKNRTVRILRGGMNVKEVQAIVEGHNKSEDDVLICSESYAESFELPRSSVGFFCGFGWSWDTIEQAEDRMRRLSSESKSSQYFFMYHPGYIDEDVFNVVTDTHAAVRTVSPQNALEMMRRK